MIARSWQCVLGGLLIHFTLGTLYCWGIITTAVTAHLRQYDDSLTYNKTLMVYAAALACQGATMYFGGLLDGHIGARYTCMIGGYILVLGTFLSASATSLVEIVITDGVMFGFGVGLCYVAPIACASRWLPQRKGLVTGIIVGGFGGGSFFFGMLSTAFLNRGSSHEELVDGYYPSDSNIASRVPSLFYMLGTCYFVLITAGCLLLTERPQEALDSESLRRHDNQESSSMKGIAARPSQSSIISLNYSPLSTPGSGSDVQDGSSLGSSPNVVSQRLYQGQQNNDDSVLDLELMSIPDFESRESGGSFSRNSNSAANSVGSGHSITRQAGPGRSNGDFDVMNTVYNQLPNNESSHAADSQVPLSLQRPEDVSHAVRTEAVIGPDKTPGELLRDSLAWHLASCFALTALGGMYVAGTYKVYGQDSFKHDEAFLSGVGSAAAIFSAVGRIIWGSLSDKFGPINTLIGLSFLFAIMLCTYSFSPLLGHAGFALWTFGIFFFEGGNFALYMPVTIQLFGLKNSSANYGLIFTSYAICNVTSISLLAGMDATFLHSTVIMGLFTFLGFLNLLFLKRHVVRRELEGDNEEAS